MEVKYPMEVSFFPAVQLHDKKNQVEQVFKVGTCCWVNKCSRSSMMIQKEDAKGNQNKGKMKNSVQH
jgi:hypothetical protein